MKANRELLLRQGSRAVASFGLALATSVTAAPVALAQGQSTSDEIVVTGSSIRGTPEDAALPVDVISVQELERQGSPTMVEILRNLPVSTGILGETNQFETRSQATQGLGSVNLRGLGPQRTLVLLNGRRITPSPAGGIVDTNLIPLDAVGRIEVLKDGAAAIYGSDAIGGVVNIITRTNFEGFEAGGSYKYIDGSDGGDYTVKGLWGWNGERTSVFVSAGYQHRGELQVIDRDFANAPFGVNPQAGWSTASSATAIYPVLPDDTNDTDPLTPGIQGDANTINDIGVPLLDPGCAPLGGIPVANLACRFQFLDYDNLVEEEERYQIYGQINTELAEGLDLHVEAFYAKTDQPFFKTSPGYGGIQYPSQTLQQSINLTGGAVPPGAGFYFVPVENPGLTQPGGARTAIGALLPAGALGAALNQLSYRTFSFGGNPYFPSRAGTATREYDEYRVSGELTGEWNGVTWNAALTYSQDTLIWNTYDALVARLELAMRGYGSLKSDPEGCTAAETNNFTTGAGNAALGCYWFNPFSNSIPQNFVSGEVNNGSITPASPAVLNSPDLIGWFYQSAYAKATNSLAVADLAFSGDAPVELPGGQVAWALGGQFRRENYSNIVGDLSNARVTPCVDTPIFNNISCAVPQGPFHFLGSALERDVSADVYAVFGELQIPVFDTLNIQVAARYEDYGGEVGSTFDPKISLKWDLLEWLSLRASAGSTFRGPPQTSLGERLGTSFEFIPTAGRYLAVNNFGNPGLEPESADTFSAGLIYQSGNFKFSADYWRFDFENPIVTQTSTQLAAALFAAPANCTSAAYADLRANHFVFNGACSAANLSAINVQVVNGPSIFNDGLDILADYRFDDVLGGTLSLGGSFTYVYNYETDDFTVDGITVAPAFEAVGRLNIGTTAYSIPQLKGSLFGEYTFGEEGAHNIRATVNYVDSYVDQRTAGVFSGSLATIRPLTAFPQAGKTIDKWISLDLDYRAFLPWDTTLAVSVDNVTDEDPPFARLNLSYDPGVHSPLGRTFRVGLTKHF